MFSFLKNNIGRRHPTHAHSLVAVARLSGYYKDGRSFFTPDAGHVATLGLVDNSSGLVTTAPSAEPALRGSFYTDKFIDFVPTSLQQNGFVELKEDYVYDNQYRCEIDYTGIRLTINLDAQTIITYREFIGKQAIPALTDREAWNGNILVCVPAPNLIFPTGRGSVPPYPPAKTRNAKVGKTRSIKKLSLKSLLVSKIDLKDILGMDLASCLRNIDDAKTLHLDGLCA